LGYSALETDETGGGPIVLQVTVMLKPEVRERVAQEAARKNRSFAGQVRHFLSEGLQRVQQQNGSAVAPLPWLADAKRRLEAMQAEQARLARIDEAEAEARARQIGLDISVLAREIDVAERLTRVDD
jgi:hypothetical protein